MLFRSPSADSGPEGPTIASSIADAAAESGATATLPCGSPADDAAASTTNDTAAAPVPADGAPSPITLGGDATELEDGELSNDDNNNDNEEAKEMGANPSPRPAQTDQGDITQ